jgi:hypothetical protein
MSRDSSEDGEGVRDKDPDPSSASDEEALELPTLHCRDCPLWYGEENRGWGPCSIKHQRGDIRYITFGGHECDEDYHPPVPIRPGKADRLRGVRSTSRRSAVGYSSTRKAGRPRRGATRRSRDGDSSSR